MNSMIMERDRLYRDALGHIDSGRLQEAVAACSTLGARFPRFAEGWYVSSVLAQRLGNPAKALEFIDRALALEAANPLFVVRRASVLASSSRSEEADALIRSVDVGEPRDLRVSGALATYYTHAEKHELALRHYRAIAAWQPDSTQNLFNLAATERFLGNIAESERAYTAALAKDPANWEAYYLRSGLRRQTQGNNHVVELEQALARVASSDWMGRSYVYYAIAKELEDLGEYARSFEALRHGAASRRSNMRYDVADDVDTIHAIIDNYSAATLGRLAGGGHPSREPIFVLGLPRTGTTLVERILGSHSAVSAAGELNNFAGEMSKAIASGSGGRRLSKTDMIAASRDLDFAALGRRYIESTRPKTGHLPRFVDKMPLNYLYCGLIASALPNARIIELVRHPLDTCYAIYKQLFTSAYPFSYDLDDIAAYYLAYLRLMDHWHRVLPGRIHRLPYEALIANQQRETDRLLAFCGLDFEPACSNFEQNPNGCTTASAVQVRQKIYSSSVGKWEHFAEQLAPLRDRLRSSSDIGNARRSGTTSHSAPNSILRVSSSERSERIESDPASSKAPQRPLPAS